MRRLYNVNRAIRGVAVLWGLASIALLMLPIALFYHPKNEQLGEATAAVMPELP